MLILDEADRLFDLGFVNDIDEIIAACSSNLIIYIYIFIHLFFTTVLIYIYIYIADPSLVRGLFSATLPEGTCHTSFYLFTLISLMYVLIYYL